jgi:aspartate carbamoyltransferase catalytic subunit
MSNRNLITIDDLTNNEIEDIFSLADEISDHLGGNSEICRGKILASLFFEPSTRTRLSFETAMHRLGGHVISTVDTKATSLAKGESIADMARVIGSYADIIVIRHPWEGTARVVADYANVPVINAGDGGHEHPTQTLCDLYTIKKERQTIKGLKIALWGDLKHGRTIHSLSYALARFGATIHFYSGPGLEMPDYVKRKLTTEYKGKLYEVPVDINKGLLPLDAVYITPDKPHQLAMMPDIGVKLELEAGVGALYVTRLQRERLENNEKEENLKLYYPIVDKKLLRGKKYKETLVMHPLPRVNELAYELDNDPRSTYFKQAARGVPIRMALITLLLGVKEIKTHKGKGIHFTKRNYLDYNHNIVPKCYNTKCVTNQDTEANYIKPKFKLISTQPLILRCLYCEHEIQPQFIASSDWHQGKLEHKKYHLATSHWVRKIKPENLIVFNTDREAQTFGFKPSNYLSKNQT